MLKYVGLIAAALACVGTYSANAETYYAPIQIVKDSMYCASLAEYKMRENLIAQRRDEALGTAKLFDAFIGTGPGMGCGLAKTGQFMFMEGYAEGKYVCLRMRPGSNCFYLKRDAVGENFELYPGRTFEQGNKGVTCAQWAKAVEQSKANLERDRRVVFGPPSGGVVDDMGRRLGADMLNMFTGSQNAAQQTSTRLCIWTHRDMQEKARQLKAFEYCPQLDVTGARPQMLASYESLRRSVREYCIK